MDPDLNRAAAPLQPPALTRQVLSDLKRSLEQGLQDLEEAARETEPGSAERDQRLRAAVSWGIHGLPREVMALALEAATARLRAESDLATRTG